MKFYCFIIAFLYLLCFQLKAQNVDFVFKKEFNVLIAQKEGKSPYAFEIIREKFTTTNTKPATKRISQFYKKTLAFSKKAKSDSTKIAILKKESLPLPEDINETEVNNRLRIARRSLKTVKKYEIVSPETVTKTYYKLKIRKNIFKPENVIFGKFQSLGLFYITKNIDSYKENNLISVSEAKKNKLTNNYFLIDKALAVIENIETKTIYMVYPEFLEKYAINKVALQQTMN